MDRRGLRKAVHPNPLKRYDELSELVFDLRHPNSTLLRQDQAPLMQRNPLLFWKGRTPRLAAHARA